MHAGQVLPISSEAFERFTFDLLFSESDFGDTDEEAGTHYTDVEDAATPQEEESLAKGYVDEERTWEADLSRMVALRKRQDLTRMDTIRPTSQIRQPLPSLIAISPPDDFDSASEPQTYSGNESDEFATPSELIEMDPLYFPSLLSIVRSIIPELRTRLVRWVLPTSGLKLPTHADDLKNGGGVSLPIVGILCAVAASAGFWAGVAARSEVFVRL